jgi:hypothetical protein
MGVGTAQEHNLLRGAQRDVRHELPAAAQVAIVFLAHDRRTNPLALTSGSKRHCCLLNDGTARMSLRWCYDNM